MTKELESGLKKLLQFTSNDRFGREHDINWWKTNCLMALDKLKHSELKDEDDIEARAVVCATISAVGLAMSNHFASAVVSLGHLNSEPVAKAMIHEIARGDEHRELMEKRAKNFLS
jgi:hypothetical protein